MTFAYQSDGGDDVVVRVQDGTIWLTQKQIGLLFDTSADNVSLHLKNIFNDGELVAISVTEDFLTTAADGKNYVTKHYCFDAIIAVGYRINSKIRFSQKFLSFFTKKIKIRELFAVFCKKMILIGRPFSS